MKGKHLPTSLEWHFLRWYWMTFFEVILNDIFWGDIEWHFLRWYWYDDLYIYPFGLTPLTLLGHARRHSKFYHHHSIIATIILHIPTITHTLPLTPRTDSPSSHPPSPGHEDVSQELLRSERSIWLAGHLHHRRGVQGIHHNFGHWIGYTVMILYVYIIENP